MIKRPKSLYSIIGFIVISIIIVVMSILLTFNYMQTKHKLYETLNEESYITLERLKRSLPHFITSYEINEYEKLLATELKNQKIYAIIVEDYKTGALINKPYITGKIRDIKWDIVDYDNRYPNSKKFLFKESAITFQQENIGKIKVFYSYKFLNEELNSLITKSIFITLGISILLIALLFWGIKIYVLEPISNISDMITNADKNGIPLKTFSETSSYELSLLTKTMNTMLYHIKTSKEKIENEQHKYQKLMNNSNELIFIMDTNGNLLEHSNLAQDFLGYNEEEMKKLTVFDWDKSITLHEYKEISKQLSSNPTHLERIYTKKDGSTYIVSIQVSLINISGSTHVYASVRDITKEKQNQQLILQQKEEFETIFKYAQDGIAITDFDCNLIQFNESFQNMTEYTKEELLHMNCMNFSPKKDSTLVKKALDEVILKGHIENFEKEWIVNNGKHLTVYISISVLPDQNRLLFIVKDTTSIKLLEEQTKLASMGEMIGNIAHQWRQPLSVITVTASGVKMLSEFGQKISTEEINECADIVVTQAKHLSDTIDNFRDFLKGETNYRTISVLGVIEHTYQLVNASLKNNYIHFVYDIDKSLKIHGNINELTEAFINIINNSKDAIKENITDDKKKLILVSAKQNNKNEIEILFKDSGGGIPENMINRVFEPYFTSKHKSVGTGLGLAMVNKIIQERHNGSITAFNDTFTYDGREFTGACFKVVLPQEV